MRKIPCLWIVIPCYNEGDVLPITAPMFLEKLQILIEDNRISKDSRILFVDDGSKDSTWDIISSLSKTKFGSSRLLTQVNHSPSQNKSQSSHASRVSLNSLICACDLILPSNFSLSSRISLKSAPTTHGNSFSS